MSDAADILPPPRTVKPRTREYRWLPVIVIHNDQALTENGEVMALHDLIAQLPRMQPTLFAAVGSADILAQMDAIYSSLTPAAWQFRISHCERDIVSPNGRKVAARVTVGIHYFGWKNGNYHKMIDPVTMTGHSLDKIIPQQGLGTIGKLMKWATDLRDFCDANGIEVRPTQGAISAQLLTDPRFYPDARRKVPQIINESVREQMPGNFYQLKAQTNHEEYTAIYIDQSRAHHYHARTSALPDANLLYAHGRFTDLDAIVFDTIPTDFYGLYCLDLAAPTTPPPFTWVRGALTRQFVFTNELPHLLDMGYRVIGIRAAWGSRKQDTGLARYAAWAETQLDHYDNAAWLKPLLLAAYGVLATRPRYGEAVFRQAKSGIDTTIPTGKYSLTGKWVASSRKLEPGIANVIHRGMIEAATRSESVGLAQHLTGMGFKVLSIYADAVIVQLDEDKSLPMLPEPWRIKRQLTHLQFLNQQAFISGEMTKLPGVGGRDLLKHTRRSGTPSMRPEDIEDARWSREQYYNEMFGGK